MKTKCFKHNSLHFPPQILPGWNSKFHIYIAGAIYGTRGMGQGYIHIKFLNIHSF